MTLLEQITASAVAAVLISASSIGWVGFVNAQNVKNDANTIQVAIRNAQSEAKLKKLMSNYLLRVCQTEYTCNIAEKMDTVAQGELAAVIDNTKYDQPSVPSVEYHNLLESKTPAELLDLITSEVHRFLAPSVSNPQTPALSTASLSAPYWEQYVELSQQRAIAPKTNPFDLIDMSQIEDKAAKTTPKVTFLGCYQSNGNVAVQTTAGLVQFNPAMLPAGVQVNMKLLACPNVPKK